MKIYGYLVTIAFEKGEWGYVAYAPGIGGVYEEGATKDEAISNAYESACAIIDTRSEQKDPISEDNPYLKVLTVPPKLEQLTGIQGISDGYIVTPRCPEPIAVA